MEKIIGVISDTHGALHPDIETVFHNVDLIIHAGDIGSEAVFRKLESIAPVTAVRGNMDYSGPLSSLPEYEMITVLSQNIYILHDLNRLDLIPVKADISVVISGHTHCPKAYQKDGVLYLNPGSSRLPRHSGGPSVAFLSISKSGIQHRHIEL